MVAVLRRPEPESQGIESCLVSDQTLSTACRALASESQWVQQSAFSSNVEYDYLLLPFQHGLSGLNLECNSYNS